VGSVPCNNRLPGQTAWCAGAVANLLSSGVAAINVQGQPTTYRFSGSRPMAEILLKMVIQVILHQ
jgi:hypothetical protein